MTDGTDPASGAVWSELLLALVDRSHLVTGDRLADLLDQLLVPLGLTPEAFVANLSQRLLLPIRPPVTGADAHPAPLEVEGSLAGRAYQTGEILGGHTDGGDRVLWVPMVDGTERTGVLRIGLAPTVVDDTDLRRRCWSLGGLTAHIAMLKLSHSDRLRRLRADGRLSTASELLWQLVPPRTFATDKVVLSALLEPFDQVAGDAYDYAVDHATVDLAVYDGVGHDLDAGLATALAITAVRNARRRATEVPLTELADAADAMLRARAGPPRFVTGVLARFDTDTGVLDYLNAGHPPPLLVRDGHIVKELTAEVEGPLGRPVRGTRGVVGTEQLEPGDRLLIYSDGIVEARDPQGAFFGVDRLVDFTERAEMDRLSAPETLRRLAEAVLAHQGDQLQDDATLLMVDWSSEAHKYLFPTRGALPIPHDADPHRPDEGADPTTPR